LQPCPVHQRDTDSRGGATARGYGSRWQRVRRRYLREHPLCVDCMAAGFYVPATEVHHTVKAQNRPDLFWDESLWRALCEPCHSKRTARGE
jgi:5-methylcytosine-specific restriction enzyme A